MLSQLRFIHTVQRVFLRAADNDTKVENIVVWETVEDVDTFVVKDEIPDNNSKATQSKVHFVKVDFGDLQDVTVYTAEMKRKFGLTTYEYTAIEDFLMQASSRHNGSDKESFSLAMAVAHAANDGRDPLKCVQVQPPKCFAKSVKDWMKTKNEGIFFKRFRSHLENIVDYDSVVLRIYKLLVFSKPFAFCKEEKDRPKDLNWESVVKKTYPFLKLDSQRFELDCVQYSLSGGSSKEIKELRDKLKGGMENDVRKKVSCSQHLPSSAF